MYEELENPYLCVEIVLVMYWMTRNLSVTWSMVTDNWSDHFLPWVNLSFYTVSLHPEYLVEQGCKKQHSIVLVVSQYVQQTHHIHVLLVLDEWFFHSRFSVHVKYPIPHAVVSFLLRAWSWSRQTSFGLFYVINVFWSFYICHHHNVAFINFVTGLN